MGFSWKKVAQVALPIVGSIVPGIGTAAGLAASAYIGQKEKQKKAKRKAAIAAAIAQQEAAGGGKGTPEERQPYEAGRTELEIAQSELESLPRTVREQVIAAAKRAGTFAETPEFARGAESEIEAQLRGARFATEERIRALRRKLGLAEEGPALGA